MKVGDITLQNQADVLPKPYISYFTRDVSTGTGTQAVTGLGFKPSSVFFLHATGASDYASWGGGNATQNRNIVHDGDGDLFLGGAAYAIVYTESIGSDDYRGAISSIDTDGFTIQWTLIGGSPTGTAVIPFKAFK